MAFHDPQPVKTIPSRRSYLGYALDLCRATRFDIINAAETLGFGKCVCTLCSNEIRAEDFSKKGVEFVRTGCTCFNVYHGECLRNFLSRPDPEFEKMYRNQCPVCFEELYRPEKISRADKKERRRLERRESSSSLSETIKSMFVKRPDSSSSAWSFTLIPKTPKTPMTNPPASSASTKADKPLPPTPSRAKKARRIPTPTQQAAPPPISSKHTFTSDLSGKIAVTDGPDRVTVSRRAPGTKYDPVKIIGDVCRLTRNFGSEHASAISAAVVPLLESLEGQNMQASMLGKFIANAATAALVPLYRSGVMTQMELELAMGPGTGLVSRIQGSLLHSLTVEVA